MGCARGTYNLALCYGHGEGVKKDKKKAAELLHKAADMGNNDAQHALKKGCSIQ